MSLVALMGAVKSRLQSVLTLTDATCDVMFDGQPKPSAGEEFIAVHPGSWRWEDIEGLMEVVGVHVTLTRRLGQYPFDRRSMAITESRLRQIIAAIHLDVGADAVLNAANTAISGTVNKFVEPLRFVDGGRPEMKGPEWFNAYNPEGGPWDSAGVAQTITFDGAKRVQTIESMA